MFSLGDSAFLLTYIRDFLQILILAWIIYKLYVAVASTKIYQLVLVIMAYAMFFCVCWVFDFTFLLFIYRKITLPLMMFFCIIYPPEFRRAFTTLFSGRARLFRIGSQTTVEQIDTILNACENLVQVKRGALIIFPRHTDIKSVIDSGTKLNADLSSSLICTIFDHDTPLHDGALVVQGGKIVAASCYLPLSAQTGINASFGTRHRAALGLAEDSDAVIIIVSEENGAMSLAYNANIYYDLDRETIKNVILALMSYHDVTPQDVKEEEDESKK